jgi:hypothetical protein
LGDQHPLVFAQAGVAVEIGGLIELAAVVDLPVAVEVRIRVEAGGLVGRIPKRIGVAVSCAAVASDFHPVED